jgi:hypothetical protein
MSDMPLPLETHISIGKSFDDLRMRQQNKHQCIGDCGLLCVSSGMSASESHSTTAFRGSHVTSSMVFLYLSSLSMNAFGMSKTLV